MTSNAACRPSPSFGRVTAFPCLRDRCRSCAGVWRWGQPRLPSSALGDTPQPSCGIVPEMGWPSASQFLESCGREQRIDAQPPCISSCAWSPPRRRHPCRGGTPCAAPEIPKGGEKGGIVSRGKREIWA